MTTRIEVKTKAAAEKAIAKGQPIRIVGGSFVLTIVSGYADISTDYGVKASVVARESSSVVARESSRVEAWESSSVEAWGSSSVVARGSSRVEAWGSSRVEAWESSSVEAWESSSVVAWGSSSVVARESSRVAARGYCFLDQRSSVPATASQNVSVNLWNGATCGGGRQQVVKLSTPRDWCEYYGARIEGENAIVYKAVGEKYMSYHGVEYAPGTMPSDPDWDGNGVECTKGGGLNFSPTPRHTHNFVSTPAHYLECRVALDEMVVHFDGHYPEKCCAPRVVAPLIEVDVDGNPIQETDQ